MKIRCRMGKRYIPSLVSLPVGVDLEVVTWLRWLPTSTSVPPSRAIDDDNGYAAVPKNVSYMMGTANPGFDRRASYCYLQSPRQHCSASKLKQTYYCLSNLSTLPLSLTSTMGYLAYVQPPPHASY